MKRIASAVLLLLLTSFAAAQRLPELAVPDNYKLVFAPDFVKDSFSGDETIQIRVLKPTAKIVLNAAEIDFHQVTIASGGATQQATVTSDKVKEFVTLTVAIELQPGPATIRIAYTGILNGELRGFYLGKEQNGKKYAVTQFESTDARRAFPSFDEPAYKATFDVTVIAGKDQTAISNRQVISDSPGPGAEEHTVKFATTAKMSSYLVAIAVGDFEYIEGSADGVPIRVYTFPGKKQQGAFALESAEQCLKYYDRYFGVKYAFGKLDLIGLPDFAAGAMENAGAITFREVDLLSDDQHSSTDHRTRVALVVAHEIAHQWFGDLVTMQWWDDIWLNEGFATWMETKPVAEWKPEWHLNLGDVLDANDTMNVDSLASTRPIHQAAETPGQIQELFDGIAYGKAAAVLRTLEAYMGPETFRKGVTSYIKQHAYGNSTAEDFWNALTAASDKPIDRIMPTFVTQAGVPIVSVRTQCSANSTKVTLSQQRYSYDRSLAGAGSNELWMIPVCLKASGSRLGAQQKCELFTKKQEEFAVSGCSPWVLANGGATGYFRSSYDSEAVRAMSRNMQNELTAAERIRLISDEWASVRAGLGSIGDFMALVEGLKSEHVSAVMEQGVNEVYFIGDNLVTDADRASFQQWVRGLFAPLAKELGTKPSAGESDDLKSLRSDVFSVLGYSGRDPEVLAGANRLAHAVLTNPDAVDPSMTAAVFRVAALTGEESLYNEILEAMKTAKSPEEFYTLGGTLTRFTDSKLIDRTLRSTLTPAVRTQDAPHVIAAVMRNPAGRQMAWDFVRAHWQEIEKMLAGYSAGAIVASTGSFCDAEQRDQVKSFFAEHPFPAAERTLKQSLERANDCIDLKSQQSSQVAAWLEPHASGAGN